MTPAMPPVKEGTKADLYIKACHKRIWALARIINPGVTGDCLEVADKIIKEKKNDKV